MYKIQCSYSNTNIDIELHERISVLSADSGIGKTFVVKGIKEALKVRQYGAITATKNDKNIAVTIIEASTMDSLDSQASMAEAIKTKTGIVIIDDADKILAGNNNLTEAILCNKEAAFLLIMRGMFGNLYASQKQYLQFNLVGNSIIIKPVKRGIGGFVNDKN